MMQTNWLRWTVMLTLAAAAHVHGAQTADATVGTDWPCFRGPNRDGIAPGSPKLADKWPKDGPKLLWRSGYIPSGMDGGWSSCVAANGKVFVYFIACAPKDPAKGLRPITAEVLAEWGWREDLPADLVKKIEDERKTPGWNEMQRRNNKAEMAEFAKKFAAGLDPKVAEKYASVIDKRFTNIDAHGAASETGWSWGGSYSWPALEQFARHKDQEFKTSRDFQMAMDKLSAAKNSFYQWTGPFNAAFGNAAEGSDGMACLDANTGKELWRTLVPRGTNPAPRGSYCVGSTPAAANGKVYVSGQFWLYCLSEKDGTVIWKKPLGSFSHSSPLVLNGAVICCADGPLSAYDGETGKVLWQQPKAGGSNSSPVLWTHDGKTYVVFAGYNPCCVDPARGTILWQDEKNHGDDSTPAVSGDYLLIGLVNKKLFKLTPQKAELLWSKGGQYGDHIGSPLIYNDCVFDTGGVGRCLDLKTGEIKWSESGFLKCDYATPCIVDGKVIAYPQCFPGGEPFGYIAMYRPVGEKFELLSVFKPKFENLIPGEKGDFCHIVDMNFVTSPAVAGGKLFVRMADSVYCYDLRQ